MAEQAFYTMLTEAGLEAYARAASGGRSVDFAFVAVGDGGGVAVQPAETWTALTREVWRGAPILVEVDEANPRIVIIELYIPHSVGGFTVREVGLLDADGTLLAVGNYPDTYKPDLTAGAATEMRARFLIEHTNASKTVLKIDPAIVMASRKWVLDHVAQRLYGIALSEGGELLVCKPEDGDAIDAGDYGALAMLPGGARFSITDNNLIMTMSGGTV